MKNITPELNKRFFVQGRLVPYPHLDIADLQHCISGKGGQIHFAPEVNMCQKYKWRKKLSARKFD